MPPSMLNLTVHQLCLYQKHFSFVCQSIGLVIVVRGFSNDKTRPNHLWVNGIGSPDCKSVPSWNLHGFFGRSSQEVRGWSTLRSRYRGALGRWHGLGVWARGIFGSLVCVVVAVGGFTFALLSRERERSDVTRESWR